MTAVQRSWECPKCGRVYAQSVVACGACGACNAPTSTTYASDTGGTTSDNLREDVLEERLREMTARCVQADDEIARQDDALALVRREVESAHRRVDAQDAEIARLRAVVTDVADGACEWPDEYTGKPSANCPCGSCTARRYLRGEGT